MVWSMFRNLTVVAFTAAIGCGEQSASPVLPPPNPVIEFPVAGQPSALAVGPDGNIWFTEQGSYRMGYLTAEGFSTDFWSGIEFPGGIAVGPDGNLWVTGESTVYSITTAGAARPVVVVRGLGIVTGPDAALWFAEANDYKIGRVTPEGAFKEFPLASGIDPQAIIAGPDGNLWFSTLNPDAQYIGRITPAGEATEFLLAAGPTLMASALAVGSDGNIWFTASNRVQHADARIGRIDVQGSLTLYNLPTGNCEPSGITAGADGNLWFVESATDRIGRITTSGEITEYQLPSRASNLTSIVTGPDGTLWFAESNFTIIGSLKP